MGRTWIAICAIVIGGAVLAAAPSAQSVSVTADTYGLVDPSTGIWHLYEGGTQTTQFYFGDPGDYPFMGDWNCNEVDTPGLYRQSDGYVYLRNSNTQGPADVSFFFGNPGDVPIAGDFNADGCDTVSIYRPSNQTFYIINKLGTKDGGLGAADYSYVFGDPGDQPFVGDFNGNGQDTPGLHRATTGLVYYRNTNTTGIADNSFIYGDPGDRFVTGDWTANGVDSPGLFRPSNSTMYLRYENSQGNADASWAVGSTGWLPVAGRMVSWAVKNCGGYTYCISGTLEVDQVSYPDGAAFKSGDFDHLPNVDSIEYALGFEATPTHCSSDPKGDSMRHYSIADFGLAFRGDQFLEDTFGPAVTSIGSVDIMYLTESFGNINLDIHLADTSVTGYTFEVLLYGLDLNTDTDGCPVMAPLPAARTQQSSDSVIFREFTLNYFEMPGGHFRDFASGPADLDLR